MTLGPGVPIAGPLLYNVRTLTDCLWSTMFKLNRKQPIGLSMVQFHIIYKMSLFMSVSCTGTYIQHAIVYHPFR